MKPAHGGSRVAASALLLIVIGVAGLYLVDSPGPGRPSPVGPADPTREGVEAQNSSPSHRKSAAEAVPAEGHVGLAVDPPSAPCVRLHGVVNSLVGVPLPNVALRVSTSGGGEPLRIRSDAAGTFAATLPGGTGSEPMQVNVDGDDPHYGVTTYTTTVSCGADPVVLQITLVATPDRCWVSGVLRWDDGGAVGRGFVGPNHRSFVDADDLGRFSLLMDVWGGSFALAYGAHESNAFCAGYTRIQVSLEQAALGRVEDLILTLERPTLTRILEVVDPEGRPLEGVRVLWNGRPPEKRTDREGRLEIRFGEGVNANVALELAGFGKRFVGLRPDDGGEVVRVTLLPTRMLRGVVVDELGAPCAGARIWISVTGTFTAQDRVSLVADQEGRFEFPATEDRQPLYLTARSREGGIGQALHHGAFPEIPLTITVVKGEPLEGVVVDSAGVPLRGALVIAYRQDQRELDPPLFNTGEDGRFTLHLNAKGTYRIQVSRTGYRRVEQPVEDHSFVEIAMAPAGSLAGRVLRPDGGPLLRFRLRVQDLDEEAPVTLVPWTHFSGDGGFRVHIPGADIDAPCRLQVESEEFGTLDLLTRVQPADAEPLSVQF